MRTMRTVNDAICATPFPFTGVETQVRGSGLKQVANYTGLVPLEVLADNYDLKIWAGSTIYVKGTDVKAPFGQQKIKLSDGKECIFVPKSAIMLVVEPEPVEVVYPEEQTPND